MPTANGGSSISLPAYMNLATACRLGSVDPTASLRLGRSASFEAPAAGRKQMRRQILSRTLLVEDNPDVRLVVEHILIDEGYEVDAAENVGQGRALLDSQPYDLLSSRTESF